MENRWPLTLHFTQFAGLLNFELADHPVYDGFELQWFDDDVHGTGMLAFLSRRDGRVVDYYSDPGLTLDRNGYQIGGGTRSWNLTDFDVSRFQITPGGVAAEVSFTDVDGRPVEIWIDDRDGRRRKPAALLAPVSAAIDNPTNLLLVWMPLFDLVRRSGAAPVIRIDGVDAAIGRLPGARLHRRHLIKYAGPVLTLEVNRDHDGPLSTLTSDARPEVSTSGRLTALVAEIDGYRARLSLDPGLPAMDSASARDETGRWSVAIDDATLTGGTWSTAATPDGTRLELVADQRWRPRRLPGLMRFVTTVVPVFKRWPTTYAWSCEVPRDPAAGITSTWRRTGTDVAASYRRATGS